MTRYKEFWFALILLILSLDYCFLLRAINDIGQNMVRLMHAEAQTRGVSDEAIYTSQTHYFFLLTGSSLVFFTVGFCIEIYLLLRRMRTGTKSRLPGKVFVLAIIPFIFSVGRVLLNLYKMDKLF